MIVALFVVFDGRGWSFLSGFTVYFDLNSADCEVAPVKETRHIHFQS